MNCEPRPPTRMVVPELISRIDIEQTCLLVLGASRLTGLHGARRERRETAAIKVAP